MCEVLQHFHSKLYFIVLIIVLTHTHTPVYTQPRMYTRIYRDICFFQLFCVSTLIEDDTKVDISDWHFYHYNSVIPCILKVLQNRRHFDGSWSFQKSSGVGLSTITLLGFRLVAAPCRNCQTICNTKKSFLYSAEHCSFASMYIISSSMYIISSRYIVVEM